MNTAHTANIVVTGAAGFIGSQMSRWLNRQGYENLVLADDFGVEEKRSNWENLQYLHLVERQTLQEWLEREPRDIALIIHLGARTDTTEFNYEIHRELNIEYSQMLWQYCTGQRIPYLYASSAATYGDGSLGYTDDHELPFRLQPLNPYGVSKNEFDKWALRQETAPPFWAGFKFFNVYGPSEYHKGRMASVIWHAYKQIRQTGQVKLFRSHRPDFNDGEQLRDFIYVNDVVGVLGWFAEKLLGGETVQLPESGLYNLGTGQARSFYDLASATFRAMGLEPDIRFIDMPEDIRDKYQYFTEADMTRLRAAGYDAPFTSLEEGVRHYVQNHLLPL